MRKHKFAFIDIEATGLEIMKHEIVEIGCVITDNELNLLEKFELKIRPERIEDADPVSLKVIHYDKESKDPAYILENALKIFLEKVNDCIMVGHNVSFDWAFLEYAFEKNKMKNTMHYHRIDTVSMAWAKLNKKMDVTHYSLRELCKYFGIEHKNPHNALSDAVATFELYKKLISL